MSTASLRTAPLPEMAADARLFTLDCEHGTTTIGYAPGPVQFNDQELARIALAKHHGEQPDCRCIRGLWQEHFGAELGEMVLVRGATPR